MIGYVTQAENVAAARASAYELSRPALEHEGRWRAFRRTSVTAVVLLVLQEVLRAAATGRLPSETYVPAVVPARMSLVVDLGMIAAYTLVAVRSLELMWAVRCTRATERVAYAGAIVLAVGGVLDVVEDLTLWARVGDATTEATLTTAWSWPMRVLVVVGLGVLVVTAVRSKRVLKQRSGPDATLEEPAPGEPGMARNGLPLLSVDGRRPETTRPDLVIACSGGGIRSASFCLGALQVLNQSGHYRRADAVVGVSGGGYMAAALHAARWRSTTDPDDQETWSEEVGADVFSQSSPEQHWLRRHTRYLLKSTDVVVQGVLSVLFGMAVNLVLLAASVLAIAWLLGWYLNASGALTGWDTADAQPLGFSGRPWSLVGYVWLVPVAAVLPFLFEKVADRFRTVHFSERQLLRRWTTMPTVWGLVATAGLLGVPLVLAGLHDFTTGSGSVWADLTQALGFASQEACAAAAAVQDVACGDSKTPAPSPVWFGTGSLAALVGAVLAVVRSATSANGKSTGSDGGWVRQLLAKMWGLTKHVVTPWVAAIVVAAVVVLALLRVTAALVDTPSQLASWGLLYGFAVVMVAVKVLTDANHTSLHHFYRERLAYAYLVRRRRGLVAPIDYEKPLRFSESRPPVDRGPRLVACAVANVTDSEVVPEKRGCTPFIFDDARIGMTEALLPESAAMVISPLYEYAADRLYRDATIPAAMAMSGAAVSPLAGRMNRRLAPYRFVLAVANARLGVWLPNPLWVDDVIVVKRLVKTRLRDEVVAAWKRLGPRQRERLCNEELTRQDWGWLHGVLLERAPDDLPDGLRRVAAVHDEHSLLVRLHCYYERARNVASKPGPYRLLKEAVGQTSIYDRRLYITDGGHYDNLGLLEALRRRPKEIIVLDASADAEDTFEALGSAIATARMDLNCEITFDPRRMKRVSKDARSVMAWGKGTYAFPGGVTGDIWLAKVVMTDGLPWDVESYSVQNPTFPRTSTGNQLYGEFDLEAYRVLGREVTRRMVHDVQAHHGAAGEEPPSAPAAAPMPPTPDSPTVTSTGVAAALAIRMIARQLGSPRQDQPPSG